MTIPRRQLVLLATLAVVAIAAYVTYTGDELPAGSAPRPSNQQGQGGQALPDAPVVNLGLERLQAEREHLPESTRNPFRFRPKPPPPAPPRAASTAPPPRPQEVLPPVPTGPPPPPPIAVKFFGLVVLRGERVATFSDTRGNTFYGKEGDIIEGRYRVLRVGTDSVDLAYLDGRGRQTIRLTGQ